MLAESTLNSHLIQGKFSWFWDSLGTPFKCRQRWNCVRLFVYSICSASHRQNHQKTGPMFLKKEKSCH